ncbi:hypothetical protein M595_1690 [Lyngbya aestuarii BL J]|uniref:Uncharacterized protein n=1 Tax=Lyngbya aestuarii BL J TaxID=1348334 RepID=U7QK81_9CYAN|nr:hypothetical protein [Lyngbya aestuarii]ERT08298.1 hypothetical protein M595_1690 [Lyngbya aestuarii BL J]
MTSTTTYPNAPDISTDDYVIIGLATCFLKEEGEVHQVEIIEPIPSAALEAILKGIPTSYQKACATTIGAVLTGDTVQIPPEFPPEVQLADEFKERLISATRTYKSRPNAQSHIALGTVFQEFNYSLERKRILNSERIVSAEDNVKQHSYTHQVL